MFGFVFFAVVRLLYVRLRRTRGLALQFSDSSDGTPSAVGNTMTVDVTVHAACDVFNTTNDVLNPSDNVVHLAADAVNLSDDVVYPTDEAMNSSYDASKVADGSASKTDGRFAAAAAGVRRVWRACCLAGWRVWRVVSRGIGVWAPSRARKRS